MSDDWGFGAAWESMMTLLVVLLCMMPLAVWKLVEIAMWLYRHVNISWGA